MSIKLKICGIATLKDIEDLSKLNVDFLGIIGDVSSKRYVSNEFLSIAKKVSLKPLVYVKVNGNIKDLFEEAKEADLLQIHRILSNDELDELTTFSKKVILYVPADESYIQYLKKVLEFTDMVLLDSPKKGTQIDITFARKVLSEYEVGIAGGINVNNLDYFIELNPKWIDISSGVETFPGKKDLNLVKQIIAKVKK